MKNVNFGLITLETEQEDKTGSYTESKGFFNDITNAYNYCLNSPTSYGINSWGNWHPNLFISGKGQTILTSSKGRNYDIEANIWINQLKHFEEFYLILELPEAVDKRELRDLLINHKWSDDMSLEPRIAKVGSNREIELKK